MDSYKKVSDLYRMMFPLGEFNGDYISACLNMRREIKNMCKNEFKLPLLMIISVLQMTPKPTLSTPVSELCRTVRINLENYCLGLQNQEGASTLIHMKTGTIIPESPSTICEKFYDYMSDYGYGDDELLILSFYGINGMIRPYSYRENSKERDMQNLVDMAVDNSQLSEEDTIKFINLISELKVDDKIYKLIGRNYNILLTRQDKEFISYLHKLFINRKIPLNITLRNVCNNYEILKFKSSVGL